MKWMVALLLGLAFLAGCTEAPQEAAAPPEAEDEEDEGRTARQGRSGGGDGEEKRTGDVTQRSYADQATFTLTSANALIRFGNIQGSNCLAIDGAPYYVLNGTATMTWTSQSAVTDSLDLIIRSYYGAIDEVHTGTSPLVVEFKDIEVEDDDYPDELLFGVDVSGFASVAYELDVTLDLAFEYESDIDVGSYYTYC